MAQPPLPSIECCVCGRKPRVPLYANPKRHYFITMLRDDGWHIRMLGDGRYVSICPDCYDISERMDYDDQ